MINNPNSTNHDNLPPPPGGVDGQSPFAQGDELDVLLREWHDTNRTKAAAGRDRLLAALRAEDAVQPEQPPVAMESKPAPGLRIEGSAAGGWKLWRIAPLAAAAVLALALLAPFMLPPGSESVASAKLSNVVMCPDGGKLEAYDAAGMLLGACVLRHTDVAAEITGNIARVTLTQTFENPHKDKIEALYTFPMSNRGAVDRMSMAIGDRVIVGEVKEREEAREIYDEAAAAGLVAALTEQERPNIFTQSVANIEPGASIAVTLSYVEFVEEKDGEFTFNFPTTVAPRYIPGGPVTGDQIPGLPADLRPRRGVVLLGPAAIRAVDRGPGFSRSYRNRDETLLAAAINGATPIETPTHLADPDRWIGLEVKYADGVVESGQYYDPSAGHIAMGHIGGRWYALPTGHAIPTTDVDGAPASGPGAAFAPNTDQVPDAARITPMPVRPGTRSGQDISISVKIDTGGPGIVSYASPLHRVVATDGEKRADGLATRKSVTLEKLTAIPNRDFVLSWKQTAENVTDQVFTHTGKHGNFFGLMLRPPARVDDTMAVPREMIFVVDTSGSMKGFPIEKSKEVMEKALASMRTGDTFNVITFAGATHVLWPTARPVNEANLAEARALLAQQNGQGGTEMMTAINAALEQSAAKVDKPAIMSPEQLLAVYPGGQTVRVVVPTNRFKVHNEQMTDGSNAAILDDSSDSMINVRIDNALFAIKAPSLLIDGKWKGGPYGTVLELTSIEAAGVDAMAGVRPLRIVMFLTDGLVGNEGAIIDAVRKHRGTTRVFSFGIGNSVNRYLLDSIATEGGGAAEYVLLESEAAPAVERLTRRTLTPVLTDIRLEFSDNLSVLDIVPPLTNIPDLFDETPVTILGRYTAPGAGTVTLRGNTAAGPWERTITLSLPEKQPEHDTIATMWARAKIEQVKSNYLREVLDGSLNSEVKNQIVQLGEQFGIMSEYTSFVAVDKLRVTIAGKPRLISVPIELPAGTDFDGFFGSAAPETDDEDAGRSLSRGLQEVPEIVRVDAVGTEELQKRAEGDVAADGSGAYLDFSASVAEKREPAAPPPTNSAATPPPQPAAAAAAPRDMDASAAKTPASRAEPAPSAAKPAAPGGETGAPSAQAPGAPAVAAPVAPEASATRGEPAPSARPSGDTSRGGSAVREGAKLAPVTAPASVGFDPSVRLDEEKKREQSPGRRSDSKQYGYVGPQAGQPGGGGASKASRATGGSNVAQLRTKRDVAERERTDSLERVALGKDEAVTRLNVLAETLATNDEFSLGTPVSVYVAERGRQSQVNMIVPVQQVARRINELASVNETAQARGLADQLVKAAPDYAVGRGMWQALNEPKAPQEMQTKQVAAYAQQAEKELAVAANMMVVRRKLDERLWVFALGAGPMATADSTIRDQAIEAGCSNMVPTEAWQVAGAAGVELRELNGVPFERKGGAIVDKLAAEQVEQGVLVTVLVSSTESAVLEQLKAAGLAVESVQAKVNVVVGVLPVGKLSEFAMLECVKRVEPTPAE